MYKNFLKRILDVAISLILIVASLPLFVIVAFTIYITMGAPIFFVQSRPGRDGILFNIIKFRTMKSPIPGASPTENEEKNRITKFGRLLRSTSIDEIPELINVVRGEMSLIGPRPLLVEYLKSYSPRQMRRHDVRSGITGLAQVKGRNTLSWKNKFRYDVFYAEKVSFRFDMYILFLTIAIVLTRKGFDVVGEKKKFASSL